MDRAGSTVLVDSQKVWASDGAGGARHSGQQQARWRGGVSTDYCRQSHVAFATAGMCFVIDKSTAQYSEA